MGTGDSKLKDFFTRSKDYQKRLSDLFDTVLAGGQNRIKPRYVSLMHPDRSTGSDQVELDIAAKIEVPKSGNGAYIFVVGVEDQLYQDYAMVFRALHCELNDYLKQIRELKKEHGEKKDLKEVNS